MLKNKKVLITCGPTWVPIDTMRVISNRSSGALGQQIARDFAGAGAKVTLLEGPVLTPMGLKSVSVKKFLFFDELAVLFKKELKKKYDICIHAAAVSDYKIKKLKKGKLSSKLNSLKLDLVPTEKLVHQIKKINPDIFLVAFKLEPLISKTLAVKKSRALFQKAKSDLVVANSLQGRKYKSYILNEKNEFLAHKQTRHELSKTLVKILEKLI